MCTVCTKCALHWAVLASKPLLLAPWPLVRFLHLSFRSTPERLSNLNSCRMASHRPSPYLAIPLRRASTSDGRQGTRLRRRRALSSSDECRSSLHPSNSSSLTQPTSSPIRWTILQQGQYNMSNSLVLQFKGTTSHCCGKIFDESLSFTEADALATPLQFASLFAYVHSLNNAEPAS